MKLIKDCWAWVKEWNEWGMKDWIKAGIIVLVVLFILYKMTGALKRLAVCDLLRETSPHPLKRI